MWAFCISDLNSGKPPFFSPDLRLKSENPDHRIMWPINMAMYNFTKENGNGVWFSLKQRGKKIIGFNFLKWVNWLKNKKIFLFEAFEDVQWLLSIDNRITGRLQTTTKDLLSPEGLGLAPLVFEKTQLLVYDIFSPGPNEMVFNAKISKYLVALDKKPLLNEIKIKYECKSNLFDSSHMPVCM